MAARGHTVASAPTGPKALEAALQRPPDIVLLDINLPGGLDGIEVCRRLRDAPETSTAMVVIISAMDDPETRSRAFEAGAMAYYTKPFSPTALLKEIDTLTRKHGEGG
ncbi:MAG: response regulator [Polyangiaceae bacterium]|nr:response regulator [Polyangiaceae bacterium]